MPERVLSARELKGCRPAQPDDLQHLKNLKGGEESMVHCKACGGWIRIDTDPGLGIDIVECIGPCMAQWAGDMPYTASHQFISATFVVYGINLHKDPVYKVVFDGKLGCSMLRPCSKEETENYYKK